MRTQTESSSLTNVVETSGVRSKSAIMEICRVLEKALKENKDERYETVDGMLKHVRQWRRLCKVEC